MEENDQVVKEFLTESFEYLDAVDEDLMSLESDPSNPDLLARIFRALHTIKGTGGLLDFDVLVSVAHAGEGLLDRLRSGVVAADGDVVTTLLETVDAIREVLEEIASTGKEGQKIYGELVASLNSLQGTSLGAESTESTLKAGKANELQDEATTITEANHDVDEMEEGVAADLEEDIIEFLNEGLDYIALVEEKLSSMALTPDLAGEFIGATQIVVGGSNFLSYFKLSKLLVYFKKKLQALEKGEISCDASSREMLLTYTGAAASIFKHIRRTGNEGDANYLEQINSAVESQPVAQKSAEADTPVADDQAPENPKAEEVATTKTGSAADSVDGNEIAKSARPGNTIRVSVGLLDKLMNLVGELVLTRNQILQYTSFHTDAALTKSTHNLNLITSELQEGVMKTRMQPLSTIWRKFPRVVRDLAKSCDKQARIELEGAETELDKTIIEAIKDPLTHLVRNAVDHGIESPEERLRLGKPPYGTLRLHAFHEGGYVNIEISDDGAGIDGEKIKQKAVQMGLLSLSAAERIADRDMLNLIFTPGLSTAKEVSNISGRGVGMDVVNTHIERIGGAIDIQSHLNVGTTLRIRIPLTLAIIPALIVTVHGERFALPQVNLLELVRLEGEQIRNKIEVIHDTPVYRLRGKLLPLVYLANELGLEEEDGDDEKGNDIINIVVLQAENYQFGLIVNTVVDTEEVVVKPLSKLVKQIPTLAGATIMGDGKIALILDVIGLARQGGVMSDHDHARFLSKETDDEPASLELKNVLLARLESNQQIAIPLSMIARLEEIDTAKIEQVGEQEVVQYRGQLMPLVRLDEMINPGVSSVSNEASLLQVVVCAKNDVMIGLIVDEIVDVSEETMADSDRQDIVQNVTIIQQRATELINIQEIINQVDTTLFELSN